MKLNAQHLVGSRIERRWPRLNAGCRQPVEVPMTGIRHFRARAAAVKRGGWLDASPASRRQIRIGLPCP